MPETIRSAEGTGSHRDGLPASTELAGRPSADRMVPPLCLWCHEKPVKRCYSQHAQKGCKRRGPGKSMWRNYCSRTCSGEYAQSCMTPAIRKAHTERLVTYNREQTKARVIDRIRRVLGYDFKDGDHLTLAQVIRLAQLCYRDGRHVAEQAVRKREARVREAEGVGSAGVLVQEPRHRRPRSGAKRMRRKGMERPLCAWCQTKRIGPEGTAFCSRKCSNRERAHRRSEAA